MMAVVRGFLCLLVCLGEGYALYEDQIGDVDWYDRNAYRGGWLGGAIFELRYT